MKMSSLRRFLYGSQVDSTELDRKQLQTSLLVIDLFHTLRFFPKGTWILTVSIFLSWLHEPLWDFCHASLSVYFLSVFLHIKKKYPLLSTTSEKLSYSLQNGEASPN